MVALGIVLFIYGLITFVAPRPLYRGASWLQRNTFGPRDDEEIPASVMRWVETHEARERYNRRAVRWVRVHGMVLAATGAALAAYQYSGGGTSF